MYLLWKSPLLSIVTSELCRRKLGIPSRYAALLGDLGVDVSSRVSLMRSSYDCLTVMPLSSRITYVGDVGSSDVIDSCSKFSGIGDAAVFNIGDNGIIIFLMVPWVGIYLC